MSVHNFPKRGPRVMNGMARMLAQARELPVAAAAKDATRRSVNLSGQLEASIQVLKQLNLERLKLANVAVCLDSFTKQCEALPEGDVMRKVVETLITTIRQAIQAGAEGKGVSVAVTPEDGPQQA